MEIAATVRSALAVSVLASGVGALVATNAAPPSWAVRPSSADQLKLRPQNSHLLISPHSKLSVRNRIDLLCSSRRCVERLTCSVTALQYKKKSSRCDNSWELWQPASSAMPPYGLISFRVTKRTRRRAGTQASPASQAVYSSSINGEGAIVRPLRAGRLAVLVVDVRAVQQQGGHAAVVAARAVGVRQHSSISGPLAGMPAPAPPPAAHLELGMHRRRA